MFRAKGAPCLWRRSTPAGTSSTGRSRQASGTVVPGYEARLVDDAGAPVADDEPGHLLVRGDSIATGKIQRVVVREVVARRLGKPGE